MKKTFAVWIHTHVLSELHTSLLFLGIRHVSSRITNWPCSDIVEIYTGKDRDEYDGLDHNRNHIWVTLPAAWRQLLAESCKPPDKKQTFWTLGTAWLVVWGGATRLEVLQEYITGRVSKNRSDYTQAQMSECWAYLDNKSITHLKSYPADSATSFRWRTNRGLTNEPKYEIKSLYHSIKSSMTNWSYMFVTSRNFRRGTN